MKKFLALILALVMALSLVACGEKKDDTKTEGGDTATGKVYYLNFKPEQDQDWQDLAKAYTEETGVPVTVLTAASGTYEEKLTSEIAKTDAPTLFQVNGPVGLANWKDYCYDLKDSQIYGELTSDSFALKDGDAVAGIGYVIESYGLIANKTLLEKAGYTVEDIQSFDDLKKVAEDITARKDELGFAAFTSAGMDGSSDWRFKTHLANLPIYFEYQADGINSTDAIKGTYLDNYKAIFDLYINNSTCAPADLSGKTGTENYWCVNKDAAPEDIQATLDFMYWCVTSDKGTQAMANDMGFVIPFKKAAESPNLFVKVDKELTAAGKTPVSWNFTTMPSEQWKNDVGSALTAYAAGTGDWEAVKTAFVDGWAKEAALNG